MEWNLHKVLPLSPPSSLWQGFFLSLDEEPELCTEEDSESVQDILCNARLSDSYLSLARDLDVMEPKLPEDIYKVRAGRDKELPD